jgi:Radical SAM superfamily
MIHIDILEHCNFKCFFCPARFNQEAIYMKPELFYSIIDQAVECGIEELSLVPLKGEPFLHPNIYEMLEYAACRMKAIRLFSNATAINVDKLRKIDISTVSLNISQYGNSEEEFTTLTQAAPRMWQVFQDRLQQLTKAGIIYHIEMRTLDYDFDYEDRVGDGATTFDPSVKCKYHHQPRIYANGDITFCIFLAGDHPTSKKIMYANLNTTTLADALTHPLRYKFFDSQSICTDFCQSHYRECYNRVNISTVKLIYTSKQRYAEQANTVDQQYDAIYDDVKNSHARLVATIPHQTPQD